MEILYVFLASFLTALFFVILQKCRGVFGKTIILMENSKVDVSAMKKAGIGFDELMSSARLAGFFNLGDVDTAVMEKSGKISFQPKPMKRALNPKDFNFAPVREGLCKTVISNGKILGENLKKSGISKSELEQLLAKRNQQVSDILIATVNEAGRVDFFSK